MVHQTTKPGQRAVPSQLSSDDFNKCLIHLRAAASRITLAIADLEASQTICSHPSIAVLVDDCRKLAMHASNTAETLDMLDERDTGRVTLDGGTERVVTDPSELAEVCDSMIRDHHAPNVNRRPSTVVTFKRPRPAQH